MRISTAITQKMALPKKSNSISLLFSLLARIADSL
jgi:hypothetical protein